MYLFHFAFCLFSFLIFTEATKLTCNEVTKSNKYKDSEVTFKICKYLQKEKCRSIDTSAGTNFEGLKKILSEIKCNPRERIAIITHGFMSDPTWMGDMGRNWALMEPDVNVIMVQWENNHNANFEYRKAALLTESVAKKTAAFLEKLNQIYPQQRLQLHFVGHSLGAHLVGQAARILKQRGIIVDRITALDPSLPCFKDNSASLRLRKTDAEFVDVIHSNSGPEDMNLGIYEPMGHYDFYPNGGNNFSECQEISIITSHLYNCNGVGFHTQLYHYVKKLKIEAMREKLQLFSDYKKNENFLEYYFCKNNACNHKMATKFFIESLNPNNTRRLATFVPFPLHINHDVKCHNHNNCNSETCIQMGYGAEQDKPQDKRDEGAYYVNTANDIDYESCYYD